MEQGGVARLAPSDAELQRAIASVPGVVSAGIDRSTETGRSRLRLRLGVGEDEEAVAWAVAATLRERFGIALDPDAIRPRPVDVNAGDDPAGLQADMTAVVGAGSEHVATRGGGELLDTRERLRRAVEGALDGVSPDERGVPATLHVHDAEPGAAPVDAPAPATAPGPSAPADGVVVPRAAIEQLAIRREPRRVEVSVMLRHRERTATGRVISVPTTHGTFRAVAEATVGALRSLTQGSLLVGIDRVTVRDTTDATTDAPMATVVLSLLSRRGEERLLGASMVRGDPERAVVRATLDALNRRVTPLLLDTADASETGG